MRSARLFLPLSISLFMKRVRVRLPNRGSGGTSRLTTRARRGMNSPLGVSDRKNEPCSSGTEDRRGAAFVKVPGWLLRKAYCLLLRADPICLGLCRPQAAALNPGYLVGAFGAFAPYLDRPCLRSLTPP